MHLLFVAPSAIQTTDFVDFAEEPSSIPLSTAEEDLIREDQ
jgi:hypothetical protein